MGIDIGFQNNARYWKLVHKKVTKRWYQRYLNGLAVMFFLPRFFLAWYFKCPELTQPLSHDSSKNQTAYQKDIVEQNLAQVFIWTGIHCFVSSVNWFRLCKTKYVTDVSGTDKIFALLQHFLSFEDAYEKAQLKKPKDEKARMFFMANIIFALFDYSILKNSYHYQQIKWIFSYKLRPEPPSAHQQKFNSARSTTKSVTDCDTKNSSSKKRRKIILACLVFWFWYCCVAPKASYLLHLMCTKVNICMKSMLVPTAQSWHKNLIEDFFTICANFNYHLKNTPNHNKFHSWSFESTRLSSPSLTSFVSTASSSTSTSSLWNSHIYSFSIFCNL